MPNCGVAQQNPIFPNPEIDLTDTARYPWYNDEFNVIQFANRSALTHFYNAWKNGQNQRINIIHTGDSHIQSDIPTAIIRDYFQSLIGKGGRGLIFPYSTANTYSSIKYASKHEGAWMCGKTMQIPPKLPLGVCGMTSRTEDAKASFTITWKEEIPDHYTEIRIFLNRSEQSFDLLVKTNDQEYPLKIAPESATDSLPYVSFSIEKMGVDISFIVKKNNPLQKELELNGIEILSNQPNGLVYHAVGVGGSRFRGILYEDLFESQLPHHQPDLFILDFGTNDYLYDDSVKVELPDEIRDIVGRIRRAWPQTSILLTTTQDLYYKNRNIRSGDKFSALIASLANELDCAFWDYYWVSGGRGVLKKWQQEGLAQNDLIHLTSKGYRLKGRLFVEAMMRTIELLDQQPERASFLLDPSALLEAQKIRLATQPKEIYFAPPKGTATIYKIKPGDTLGGIAQKYKVTVKQLQQWNNLKGTTIVAGKTLKIYK